MAGLDNSYNGSKRIEWWKRSAFPVILAAVIGALGGGPGYRALQDPREHPYTSLDAHRDKAEVLMRVEALGSKHEARMDRMESRANAISVELANKPPDELIERVTRLEVQCEWLQRTAVKWAEPKDDGGQ